MRRRDGGGSISKKSDGRFLAQLPPSLGRRSKTFDSETEAEQWLRQELAKVTLNISDDLAAGTAYIEETMAAYIEGSMNKESTKGNQRYYFERFVKDQPFGQLRLGAVRGMHIDALIARTPENHSRIQVIDLVSAFFKWAYTNDYVASNPVPKSGAERARKMVEKAHEPRPEVDEIWTPEQFAKFVLAEQDPSYQRMWTFYAVTAARRGEGCGAAWYNMFLDDGWGWLKDNVVKSGNETVIQDTPKGIKRRKVFFTPVVVDLLSTQRLDQDRHRETCATWSGDWVFDKRRSNPMHLLVPGEHLEPEAVTRRFNRLTDRLDLPRLTGPHGLRRTFATVAEDLGYSERIRAIALGHDLSLTDSYVKKQEPKVRQLFEDVTKFMLISLT